MDYASALEAAKSLENGEDVVAAITSELSKKNTEAKSLRERLKTFDGVDPEKHRSMLTALQDAELDVESDLTEQISSLKSKIADGDMSNQKLSQLEKRLEKLQKSLDDEREEKTKVAQQAKRDKLASKLSPRFSESIQNAEIALDYHLGKGTFSLSEDGAIVYSANGEEFEGTADDVIKRYISDNPSQARNTQRPGSGSNPQGGKSSGGAKMKRADWMELSSKERASFFADGGELTE